MNVYYGTLQAVNNVSFKVKAGEIFGLLGPIGEGKTSTLSAVEGLLKSRSGSVTVADYITQQMPRHARGSLGVQLQITSFQPELTISEIIKLYAGIYGVSMTREKLTGILQSIKLDDAAKRKFSTLSGGQHQRVSLAIATLHNPALVLLDEPTSGLDPQSRMQL